jgi:hypothetical protein
MKVTIPLFGLGRPGFPGDERPINKAFSNDQPGFPMMIGRPVVEVVCQLPRILTGRRLPWRKIGLLLDIQTGRPAFPSMFGELIATKRICASELPIVAAMSGLVGEVAVAVSKRIHRVTPRWHRSMPA